MKPGVYTDLSNDDYHAGPGVSKSGLDLVAKCPALYKARYLDGEREEPTKAMIFGSAVHKAVLEPEYFYDEFVFTPAINRRAKAGKIEYAEFEEANKGKTVLPKDDYETIMRMSDAVISHPKVSYILSDGQAETSVFHEDEETGELVKVRPDWITEDVVVDLKTTTDAGADAFSKACLNFRYHVQAAMYSDVVSAQMRQISNFMFIVVEKKPPFPVAIYVAAPEMMAFGRVEYSTAMNIYAKCRREDQWPGLNMERIVNINLPAWAYR